MTRTLFLAWQDPRKPRWCLIGRLRWDGHIFQFVYTRGALKAQKAGGFAPLAAFPDFRKEYQSEELFPLFTNRLMPASRPDYPLFLQWLNIPRPDANPMAILARSGGHRVTDTLEVFPCPEDSRDGIYETVFFSHLSEEPSLHAESLTPGEHLVVKQDPQNQEDPNALALYTAAGEPLGYCPRFLRGEILSLMKDGDNPPSITVEKVNPRPAPIQFRVLCRLRMKWTAGFQPFSDPEFQPIGSAEKPELQVA